LQDIELILIQKPLIKL